MRQADGIKPVANSNVTRSQNVGQKADLDGANPNSEGLLVRVDDDDANQVPWLLTIRSTVVPPPVAITNIPFLGPIIKGFWGTGGVTYNFECDAGPDSILTLPGTTAQVKAMWNQVVLANPAGGVNPDTFTLVRSDGANNFLPASAIVYGGVKHGSPVTPNATRTVPVSLQAGAAHLLILDLPAFSNGLHFLCQTDAAYASFTRIEFYTSGFSQTLITYSAAQLLAFKNAGVAVPIPGSATRIGIIAPGAALAFLVYDLNL